MPTPFFFVATLSTQATDPSTIIMRSNDIAYQAGFAHQLSRGATHRILTHPHLIVAVSVNGLNQNIPIFQRGYFPRNRSVAYIFIRFVHLTVPRPQNQIALLGQVFAAAKGGGTDFQEGEKKL